MSKVRILLNTLDICCPHCDEVNEIGDFDISVTVDHTDISRPKDECAFIHVCEHCQGEFKVTPHMHVEVEAKTKGETTELEECKRLLQKHNIHMVSKGCWCNPTVERHCCKEPE